MSTSRDGFHTPESAPARPMLGGRRRPSLRSRLLAAGFTDTSRALACLEDEALTSLLSGGFIADAVPHLRPDPGPGGGQERAEVSALVEALGLVADPDLALLTLIRLIHAAAEQGEAECTSAAAVATAGGASGGPNPVEAGAQAGGSAQEADGTSALATLTMLLRQGLAEHAMALAECEEQRPPALDPGYAERLGQPLPDERPTIESLTQCHTAGVTDFGPHGEHLARLLAVLGASSALGDFLVSHPERLHALAPAQAMDAPGQPRPAILFARAVEAELGRHPQARDAVGSAEAGATGSVRPEGGPRREAEVAARAAAATNALRVAYRDRLLAIAADDLRSPDPAAHTEVVGQRMADIVDAALDAGLTIARYRVGKAARDVALAVIAMGKTGARELNYISDVDVVYVVGPAGQEAGTHEAGTAGDADEASDASAASEEELLTTGEALATELARVTSASGAEPPLWPLDTALRPEGKDGALVRTLASHVLYYERWAASWEFQALLKARAAAGDRALGAAYEAAVAPFIWNASQRENFVDDARAMRRRVENESARPGEDRRIKLGPGGLRDVEFTVQLLQLVHARADASLQVRPTLDALAALAAGGYVSREDAAVLDEGYRTLRLFEHRSQLTRLRRTHELPSKEETLRHIGRGIDRTHLADPAALRELFHATRRRVRSVHESVYYRPLLGAAASLTTDELTIAPEAARERLIAGGYSDPDGALRHIQALTEGVSRRAAIQRQLLAVVIGWLADGPDPDSGLLSFRLLSEAIGGSHWYLAMLRDSPVAARRLCHVLAGARWTTDRLAERPESIAWLDEDEDLRPRPAGALHEEVRALLRRRWLGALTTLNAEHETADAISALTSLRSRELLRAALADSLDGLDPQRTAQILTDATDAVLDGALTVATALVVGERDGFEAVAAQDEAGRWPTALADHAVIAMGRLGGGEITYASDADVLFVHQARPGADEHAAAEEADAVARRMVRLLAEAGPHPLVVDADLRPEGRQGAMSRSLDSYREYYERWGSTWERQALLRARACAGDAQVGAAFEELINPLRWSQDGLGAEELREIRRLKARMESERLPRGTDPARHLKLGPGGLSDVEWAVQILQLRHAGREPGLRTTSTLGGLEAARRAGLVGEEEARRLSAAWLMATRLRCAGVIGTGRDGGVRVDVLPTEYRELRVVGRLLGLAPGRERDVAEMYRKVARHARVVAENLIFDDAPAPLPRSAASPADSGSTPTGSQSGSQPSSQPGSVGVPASSRPSASPSPATRQTPPPASVPQPPSPGALPGTGERAASAIIARPDQPSQGEAHRPGEGAASAKKKAAAQAGARRRRNAGGPYPWS